LTGKSLDEITVDLNDVVVPQHDDSSESDDYTEDFERTAVEPHLIQGSIV